MSVSEAEAGLYPLWAIELLLLAMLAAFLSIKSQDILQKVGYLVLLNGCVTLCLTMLLHASVLTMAIVVQVGSMSYLSRKYQVSIPDWLFKVALSVVVFRLTVAPWIDYYNEELVLGLHWTLVIYPAVLGIIWFCKRINPSEDLQPWFLGIFVHVTALFITTETSYLLLGRYPDIINMQFKEAVLLAMNWLIMTVIYLWRSGYPSRLSNIYKRAGYVLLSLTSIMHFFISCLNNPYGTDQYVGDLVFSWLIPLWAIPAALLVLLVRMGLLKDSLKQPLYAIAGIFVFF